ncbi:hypothetical protein ACFXKF_07125 [Streptomyces scopuliridis]|uniref:hypothetical protein n=1 Tax=Streptomyces scopuliridis TaxID=452529 RepID=UPI00369CC363
MAPVQTTGADGARLSRRPGTNRSLPGTTTEVLSALGPAFRSEYRAERFPSIGRHVTVGNSSPISDGAAAVLINSAETAARLGPRPRARLRAFTVTRRASGGGAGGRS